jgi:hypothetical protein
VAAASMLSITVSTVAVMVVMPSLFNICITLHQLSRRWHRRSFYNNIFLTHS